MNTINLAGSIMNSATARQAPDIGEWLNTFSPAQREQIETLADTVHKADGTIGEAIKWKRLTFTRDDNWHHWLCAVAVSKGAVNLVFHKGALLRDPTSLLHGKGRYLREIPYEQAAAHREAVIALMHEAVRRQTDMLDDRD